MCTKSREVGVGCREAAVVEAQRRVSAPTQPLTGRCLLESLLTLLSGKGAVDDYNTIDSETKTT